MSLKRNSIIYLVSNITNAAIPFLLLPILTRALSPDEYGQIAMFQTLITGLAAFVGLNSIGAANRMFYDDCQPADMRKFNGSCIQVLLVSSLLLMCLSFFFIKDISSLLSLPNDWVYSSILVSFLTFIINLRLGQWQIRGEAFKYGTLQVLNSAINMGMSIVFIILLHLGSQGRVDAMIVASVFSSSLALYFLRKDHLLSLFSWKPEFIYQALAFGVPLIPHIFGIFLLSAIDRFFISKSLGLDVAGIYMVAVQLSMAISIVFDAINKAYVPWLFNVLKNDSSKEKEKVVKYTYFYYLILLFLSPLPFIVGPWFLVFISGKEYILATKVIGLLCLGQIFNGMYLMVTNYVFFAKRTGMLALVTIFSALINIALLTYLIERYGIVGAAFAFAISKLFQFLLTWLLASKVIIMPWLDVFKCRERM